MGSPIDFTLIGNYRIISYDTPFLDVTSIRGYISDTENEVLPDYAFLYYEYRWGLNGENWSLWVEMSQENLSLLTIDPNNPLYLELRITAKSNENISPFIPIGGNINPPILLNDIEPDLSYRIIDQRNFATKPKIICSDQKYDKPIIFNPNCVNTFNPYALNRAINIEQDLSYSINTIFGHEVNYYSVQPNGRGKDIILREYNLFDVVSDKCIKVLVNKNDFGDGKPIYDSFGLVFDGPIEVHIDKKYFESFFGKGAQPRKRDIIYFPLTNRIYSIEATYLHRDFNYAPIYFKCQLIKYEKRTDVSWNDEEKEKQLHDYTVNTKDLFGEETDNQIEKITKPQQYYVSTYRRNEDPIRSYISNNLPIIEYDLNNNWTIVFNSYYDLETLSYDGEEEAVRYNISPILTNKDEISFTCWFKTRNFIDKTKLVPKPPRMLAIQSYQQASGTITYSTYPVKHSLSIAGSPSDYGYICIDGGNKTGGYKILDIPDEYNITIFDDGELIDSISGWKLQKAESRTFFNGYYQNSGISIEMIWTGTNLPDATKRDYLQVGSFRILLNEQEILSPFGETIINSMSNFIPLLDDWYGFVFNLSNVFKQYSINVWGLTYDPTNPTTQTSNLLLLHYKESHLNEQIEFNISPSIEENHDNPTWHTNNNSYKILTSPLYLTNIRLFKYMIAQEKQSAILNQNIVGDSQLGIIIDNAKPIIKLAKLAKNR